MVAAGDKTFSAEDNKGTVVYTQAEVEAMLKSLKTLAPKK